MLEIEPQGWWGISAKVPATKPDDRSLESATYMVEGENLLPPTVL